MSLQENLQEEPEGLEQWRQGGLSARKVKRLQQRVQNILDDWLDYYRRATGISPLSFCLLHAPKRRVSQPFSATLRGPEGLSGGICGDRPWVLGQISFQGPFLLARFVQTARCLGTFSFGAFFRPVFLAFCIFSLETLYTVYVPSCTGTHTYARVHKPSQKSPCMPDVMHEDLVVLCISE